MTMRLLILLALPLCLLGQLEGVRRRKEFTILQSPPPGADYTGPRGSLSGTVVDSVTSAPVRKAQVRLNYAQGNLVVTDASGSFLFDQVIPGLYSITATQPNYPNNSLRPQQTVSFKLEPGERKTGIEVKLIPAAAISGRIVDEEGDAIPNCNVQVFSRNGKTIMMLAGAATKSNGEYLMENIPAGRYYLDAVCQAPPLQPRPYAPPDAVPSGHYTGYAPQFYPGTSDSAGAQRITLTPGQQLRGLDFRITPQTVAALSVHVTGLEGLGTRARLIASLEPDGGAFRLPTAIRSGTVHPKTGMALIPSVPPGQYTLQVLAMSESRTVVARQPIRIGEENQEITVQAVVPAALPGLVRQEDSAAPKPTRVAIQQTDDSNAMVQAEVQPDGTFTLRSVPPGHYRIVSIDGGFVQSAVLGGESFEGPEFELKAGAAGPLEIRLGSAMGTVTGEIQLGSNHPARIALMVQSGLSSWNPEVIAATADPVKFSVKLPPGHYRIFGVEQQDSQAAMAQINSDALQGRGVEIQVRAGAETACNLKLITAAEVDEADR